MKSERGTRLVMDHLGQTGKTVGGQGGRLGSPRLFVIGGSSLVEMCTWVCTHTHGWPD